MSEHRLRSDEKTAISKKANEASDLLSRAASIPGVADLFRLYSAHAATVAKASNYTAQRNKITVFTSSDATG